MTGTSVGDALVSFVSHELSVLGRDLWVEYKATGKGWNVKVGLDTSEYRFFLSGQGLPSYDNSVFYCKTVISLIDFR